MRRPFRFPSRGDMKRGVGARRAVPALGPRWASPSAPAPPWCRYPGSGFSRKRVPVLRAVPPWTWSGSCAVSSSGANLVQSQCQSLRPTGVPRLKAQEGNVTNHESETSVTKPQGSQTEWPKGSDRVSDRVQTPSPTLRSYIIKQCLISSPTLSPSPPGRSDHSPHLSF